MVNSHQILEFERDVDYRGVVLHCGVIVDMPMGIEIAPTLMTIHFDMEDTAIESLFHNLSVPDNKHPFNFTLDGVEVLTTLAQVSYTPSYECYGVCRVKLVFNVALCKTQKYALIEGFF